MVKRCYVQEPATLKLVPKEEYRPPVPAGPAIIGLTKPFVSPVDGTLIDDLAKLRKHNKRHGVTDARDYGESWIPRRAADIAKERAKSDKADRIEQLKHSIEKHG